MIKTILETTEKYLPTKINLTNTDMKYLPDYKWSSGFCTPSWQALLPKERHSDYWHELKYTQKSLATLYRIEKTMSKHLMEWLQLLEYYTNTL